MEIKLHNSTKLHRPTVEKHYRAIFEAQAFLAGLMAGDILEDSCVSSDFLAMAHHAGILKSDFKEILNLIDEKDSGKSLLKMDVPKRQTVQVEIIKR